MSPFIMQDGLFCFYGRSVSDERLPRESNADRSRNCSDRCHQIDIYERDFDSCDLHPNTIKVRDNVQYFRSPNQNSKVQFPRRVTFR